MDFSLNGSEEKSSFAIIETNYFDNQEISAQAFQFRGSRVQVRQGTFDLYRACGKRVLDLTLGLLMLLAAAPIILMLMLIVALDGGKPIFAHSRIGKDGRPFKCLKIRSTRPDAEEQLKAILALDPAAAAEWAADAKLTNDPRVTRIGAFLRKSSLDELPRLWNVLRGEMSLVGPRPVIAEELTRYGQAVASYMAVKLHGGEAGPDRALAGRWPQRHLLRQAGGARRGLCLQPRLWARSRHHLPDRALGAEADRQMRPDVAQPDMQPVARHWICAAERPQSLIVLE